MIRPSEGSFTLYQRGEIAVIWNIEAGGAAAALIHGLGPIDAGAEHQTLCGRTLSGLWPLVPAKDGTMNNR